MANICYPGRVATTANTPRSSDSLIAGAIDWLRESLPDDWEVDRFPMESGGEVATALRLTASNRTSAALAVDARRALTPRDAEGLFAGAASALRALAGNIPVLVVAPWLSPRTQDVLAKQDVNYIDLTGNVRLKLSNPTVYLRSQGAQKNPNPKRRGQVSLRGAKAGRLVRFLADVPAPYGVRGVATATKLNPGYVSTLLSALDREALIDRDRRGSVRSVDVEALIRRWADDYAVLRSNDPVGFLAPAGPRAVLTSLRDLTRTGRVAVTGSFAAVRHSAVAAPSLLMAFCDDTAAVAAACQLLPADTGANIVLLRPYDPVVWSDTEFEDGVFYVAPAQATVDCLTGTGRMPAEGEELLRWMTAAGLDWRTSTTDEFSGGLLQP